MKNNTTSTLSSNTFGIAGIIFKHPTSTLLLLVSLSYFLLHYYKKKSMNTAPKLPPGPSSWPIVGNVPELMANRPASRWILSLMKEMNTSIACIRLGNTHIIPVTCPEIAREFLKRQDAIFASRPLTMATEYCSHGFLAVTTAPMGEQWKKMRRVVASELLSPARLRWLLDKRTEEADNLVRYLYNLCNCKNENEDSVINLRRAVQLYSGNVVKKLMFSQRYFGHDREDGGPGAEEEEHLEALYTVLAHVYAFSVSDYMPRLRWLDLDGHEKIMKKAIRVVNKYHDPIIDERMKKWRSTTTSVSVGKGPEDLLDLLIMAKDSDGKPLLTPQEIKAQTADLAYASVDSPSNAVEWAMAEMLNQPKLLQKAVEEVDRVVGKDRLVQESDFSHLNYIKACAREAFRLHPTAPFNLPHVSTADATVAGYFIPKGSHVLLSRTGLGRNPKVWDDPLRFDPERHLKGAVVDLMEADLRFISFSAGRRGCMGAPLGSAMTVMLLARLLQGFTWSVPPGESRIELTESVNSLLLAKPLDACAEPRLPAHLYPAN